MADSQRIVRVKTRTKAFFFEEILINIPSENLPKLSKERMQYFSCPEAKLKEPTLSCKFKQLFDEQVARSKEKMTINVRQQRILCLTLTASVK